ncbi:YolD-like family protein [Paenibacillus mesophilus]|uniref:YolD-like family protein n=1 Tax=Paenibacillus mesophilus TaxID=2582849 RepID=UPI00110F5D9A|nr:YolD-like family protein [Paenibacillus mesophilus]TMV49603.1 YolD-like family protein [Paenibacillus mesophilus]
MISIQDKLYRDAESIMQKLDEMREAQMFVVVRCFLAQRDREISGIITKIDSVANTIKFSHDDGFDYIDLNDIMSIDTRRE